MEEIWIEVPGFQDYQVSNLQRLKSLKKGRERILKPKIHLGYYRFSLCKNGVVYDTYLHRMIAEVFIPNPENKPCIDHIDGNRLNNDPNNLRWVTHKENMNNPISRKRLSVSCLGRIMSDETREKISKAIKGRKSPMKGKHQSKEAKQKISEALKGENNPFFGKHHSEELKKKMSDAHNKKPVVCIKDNKIIKIYPSLSSVEKDGFYKGSVGSCCRGIQKTAGGFQWRYATPVEISEINI